MYDTFCNTDKHHIIPITNHVIYAAAVAIVIVVAAALAQFTLLKWYGEPKIANVTQFIRHVLRWWIVAMFLHVVQFSAVHRYSMHTL